MDTNIVDKARQQYLEYENRQLEILNAAIRVFNQKGYKAATTAEIAKEAGVVEPTMYKHFENKKDLFISCFRSIVDELMERYMEIYRLNKGDETGYIRGVLEAYIDFIRSNPNKSKFIVHLLSYRDDPDFEKIFTDFMRTSIDAVERIVESAKAKKLIKVDMDSHILSSMFICQYFTVIALFEMGEGDKVDAGEIFELLKIALRME